MKHLNPSIENHLAVAGQEKPDKIFFSRRSVSRKDVKSSNNCTFELGTARTRDCPCVASFLPACITAVFFDNDEIHSETS